MRRTVIFAFYLGIAVLITWPLVRVMSTELIGHPFGDSYEYVRHIWWIKHALQTGQPIFDQPLLAYPDGLSGGWLWGNPLQSFPAWLLAFIMPLPSAFNLSLLLTLALNGWAVHLLVWHLTGQRMAAMLAGVIFLAAPAFQGQLGAGHTGLLVLWPGVLYVLCLAQEETERTSKSIRWLLLAVVFFVMSLWGNQLLLIYLVVPATALFVLMRLISRDWLGLMRIIGSAVVGGALSLIFLVPVAVEQLNLPPQSREGNEVRFSADLLSAVTPSFYHPVFGKLEYTHRVLGIEPFERVGYIGILAGVLALLGVWKFRAAGWWLLLGLIAWVFSLGPLLKAFDQVVAAPIDMAYTHVVLPWAALHNLPLLNLSRTPARFNMTLAFALAIMAGYGSAVIFNRLKGTGYISSAIFIAFTAMILFEYQFFWPEMPRISGVVPEAIRAIAEREDVRAVFNVPWSHLLTDKDGLFLQTGHQSPMIAGHVTRRTPVDPAKLSVLQGTLDYALLDAAGADVVILHKEWDGGSIEPFVRDRLDQPFYEDEKIAAFNVPDADQPAQFVGVVGDLSPIDDHYTAYFYAPEAGQVVLRGIFVADGRSLDVYLDGEWLQTWQVEDRLDVELPFTINTPGYHTVTLSVEPPCPASPIPILMCRAVQIVDLNLEKMSS
jgi:hypothetical protein